MCELLFVHISIPTQPQIAPIIELPVTTQESTKTLSSLLNEKPSNVKLTGSTSEESQKGFSCSFNNTQFIIKQAIPKFGLFGVETPQAAPHPVKTETVPSTTPATPTKKPLKTTEMSTTTTTTVPPSTSIFNLPQPSQPQAPTSFLNIQQ
jgi:hypothetical protein